MSMITDTVLPRGDESGLRRWGVAALIVLLVHIGLIAAFVFERQSEMPPGNPPDAVMIDLAPVAVAPPPQEEVITPPQPQEEQQQTPPTPVQQEVPLPQPQVTEMPVEPDVLPSPQAEVMLAPPPPKVIEKSRPEHQTKKQAARAQPRTNLPRAQRAAAPAAGFNGAAASSWKSEIVMRISSVKEYPEEGRSQGASGTARVAFLVDRNGRISGVRLAGSSGSTILDRAAVETVRRANPVPAPPPGVPGGSFTIPLHFSLQ
ncbi:MAG TPA: energy transducer TonB [Methylovirgula sp.]|nr:energy transducer TonB [Methylovirgula sp.]